MTVIICETLWECKHGAIPFASPFFLASGLLAFGSSIACLNTVGPANDTDELSAQGKPQRDPKKSSPTKKNSTKGAGRRQHKTLLKKKKRKARTKKKKLGKGGNGRRSRSSSPSKDRDDSVSEQQLVAGLSISRSK